MSDIINITLAPIILFVYNRPVETLATINALKKNYLADRSDVYIFCDGPKRSKLDSSIEKVRSIVGSVSGFKSTTIYRSTSNKGLACSIINGVSDIIKIHGKVIVLEDDIVTTPNFLLFMNQTLNHYQNNDKIFSIAGYSMAITNTDKHESDVYFTRRASSWGWATWDNRWSNIDWSVSDYHAFTKSLRRKRQFNRWGSDLSSMLKKQMTGKINSWAIRWCYHQLKTGQVTVVPFTSKVINIGFGNNASNTIGFERYKSNVDKTLNNNFKLTNNICLDENIRQQFIANFSIRNRIKCKLLNLFYKK
jgi:hypothetical protein